MKHLQITLTFHLDTAFHTTGNRQRFGADKAVALDANGNPVIPATTVKGFLRENAEILLRSWGHEVCMGPEPNHMCAGHPLCSVCQIFGNPRYAAPLFFRDAQLIEPRPNHVSKPIRSGVAMSRHRRAAYPQHLFFLETVEAARTTWVSLVEGYFTEEAQALQATALVTLAAHWGAAIGGAKSRGLGWIQRIEVQAKVDDQNISEETLTTYWQGWKEREHVA